MTADLHSSVGFNLKVLLKSEKNRINFKINSKKSCFLILLD